MPPKKGQKMSLNDFLADESTGKTSWADEMDDLPMAPAPRESSYRRGGGDFLSSVPDRADRDRSSGFDRAERNYPPRDELPLPTRPPFTAFVGNLSWDLTETQIQDFFAPANTISVRVVTDFDNKPKGFGYVEFETLDGLKSALDKSGSQFSGRNLRISVAEPPKSSGPDRSLPSSAADETNQWRRSGPLPPANDTPRSNRVERSGFTRSDTSNSGFDQMDVSSGVRSGFGRKFSTAPPARTHETAPTGPPHPPREAAEPSQSEVASDWRTGKPVEGPSPHSSRRPSGPGPQSESRTPSFRKTDAFDVDEKYASLDRMGFGSKLNSNQTPPDSPANAKRGFGFGSSERRASKENTNTATSTPTPAVASDVADTWRSRKVVAATSAGGSPTPASKTATSATAAATAAAPPPPPTERKKLDLKPRSADASVTTTTSSSSTGSKPSPFGNAKPIDAAEREKQIEEKIAKREKERQEEMKARKSKAKAEKESNETVSTQEKQVVESVSGGGGGDGVVEEEPSTKVPVETSKTRSVPPPTGAWGKGRKPSGALVAEQQAAAAAAEAEALSSSSTVTQNDKVISSKEPTVDQIADQVEKTEIDS